MGGVDWASKTESARQDMSNDGDEMKRENDNDGNTSYFRMGDRLVTVNGRWYVTTREGEEGPFQSCEHAQAALERLLSNWRMAAEMREKRAARAAAKAQHKSLDYGIWDRQIVIS